MRGWEPVQACKSEVSLGNCQVLLRIPKFYLLWDREKKGERYIALPGDRESGLLNAQLHFLSALERLAAFFKT